MAKSGSGWQDGRRAWERLTGWYRGGSGHPDDGDSALDALDDVGRIRHLLDQVELVAVRTARRHGKSWAEISTKLGVTRQSAWERWRDLDETAPATESVPAPASARASAPASDGEAAPAEEPVPADESESPEIAATAAYLTERAARTWRRRSSVVVPNVIGLTWDEAHRVLRDRRLAGVGPDSDDPTPAVLAGSGAVVTDQSPESGARVPAGSTVRLWFERGGGSGVREPRRPKPTPRAGRAMRDEAAS